MRRKKSGTGITRREFALSVGAGAAAAGLGARCKTPRPQAAGRAVGPGPVTIALEVNGKKHTLKVEPRTTLLSALRDGLGLTGPKPVCDRGACGACTVLLGGEPVCSCLMLALDAQTRPILTVEGLGEAGKLEPIQEAFVEHDAMQCGYCTPGLVMSCKALLTRNPSPSADDVRAAVAGNLCRCGTYTRVLEAALAAARGKGA
jgi:aerobic-type carbon monoxide dehydrogenase small subunit (CoxS/CutS family)